MGKFSKLLMKDNQGLGARDFGPRIPESTHYKDFRLQLSRVKRGQSPSPLLPPTKLEGIKNSPVSA